MFSGFLAPAPVVLHLFLMEDPVVRGLRSDIDPFICQCRDDLAGRHACKPFFIDCVEDLLPLLRCQFIGRIGMVCICSAILVGMVYFIKVLPAIIGLVCDAEYFAGGTQAGTVTYGFVNKLYGFTAI